MAQSDLSQAQPHSVDAERAVLGALLMDNDSINVTTELLTHEDFYVNAHAILYETMNELYEEGKQFDPLTLTERLQQKKKLKDIGGQGYIVSLLESVPTSVNIAHHATIVSQKSLSRRLLTMSNKLVHECIDDGEPISTILDRAEQQIFQLAQHRLRPSVVHIGALIKDSFEQIDRLYREKRIVTGIPSGYYDLDILTAGFQPSTLNIIAARPSVGKTSFILNMVEHIAVKENMPVLFFSLEMSAESIVNRLLCAWGRVDSQKVRTGFLSQGDFNRLREAAENLHKAPIFIDDSPGMTIIEMRAKARRWQSMQNIKIIFVDYLQLMKSVGKVDNRQQEISQISSALKEMAKELKIPVVVCSQLSREIEKRREKEPKLSDLRESGSIEQDGDVIGFLYRLEQDDEPANQRDPNPAIPVEFILGKQRNGPTGAFRMLFMKKYTRFESIARAAHGASPSMPPPSPEPDDVPDDFEAPF